MVSNNLFLLLILNFIICKPLYVYADICDTWFSKSKIKKDSECLNKCVLQKVDLSTFVCKSVCNKLCNINYTPEFIFNLSSLYPGLTDSERALVAQQPKEAMVVYQQKAKAESICSDLFETNNTNDESDACRHYIWSALLTSELGTDTAQKFLNAHEQETIQPENEKAMDLANNRAGVLLAEKLLNTKTFNIEKVKTSFMEALKNKTLIVLRPKKKRPQHE